MAAVLLYGSYGYTGRLIAEQAALSGLPVILGGRNQARLIAQARKLGMEYRAARLEPNGRLDGLLHGCDIVLHCAGPFVHTVRQMATACLRTRTHYVDIGGEIDAIELLAGLDAEARDSGIALLPGAGFEVVASDCLAAHLAAKLPGATWLRVYASGGGGISRGTARSAIENLPRQGRIRREGRIVDVPPAWQVRSIDFGRGPVRALSVGWADVSTAFHSTGIPNIEAYLALTPALMIIAQASRLADPVLRLRLSRALLKLLVGALLPPGPSPRRNLEGIGLLAAEVGNGRDERHARLRTPEPYRFTSLTAVEIVKRILAHDFSPGFQTPSRLYGSDFITTFAGVVREDVTMPST